MSSRRRLLRYALFLSLAGLAAGAVGASGAQTPPADNTELARMYAEDQADRKGTPGKPTDWHAVSERDAGRESRVKTMYTRDELKTGADFYHAAMILQHASQPEDYLLAHDFCVVAIGKGEERAKWLAAASLDRFLMQIGRPQRYATQYKSDGPSTPLRLYTVDETVTDALRTQFNARTLAEARAREAELNKR